MLTLASEQTLALKTSLELLEGQQAWLTREEKTTSIIFLLLK